MIATIDLKKQIDYKTEIVSNSIEIDQQIIGMSHNLFAQTSQTLKQDNQQEHQKIIFNMFQKWQFSVFQNTAVIATIKYLKNFFNVAYNTKEVDETVEKIILKNPKAERENVINFVKESEFSRQIWNYLEKEWEVKVSDADVNTFLDDYYKQTNNSIREYKNDPSKFEGIRKDIALRKTIELITHKFDVRLSIKLTNQK